MEWKNRRSVRASLLSLSCFLLSLLATPAAAESKYLVIGEAYNIDNGRELVYREHYTERSGQSREVHYKDLDGKQFARKTLDFSRTPTQPAFLLTDERHKKQWGAEWRDDELILMKGDKGDLERKAVEVEDRQVVDAGFDAFIQQQWDSLTAGETLTFHFALPNRLSNARLQVKEVAADESPISLSEENWRYFHIRVANSFLSLFAQDLHLAYADKERRLMVFRGRSNILDERGESQDVEILYDYLED